MHVHTKSHTLSKLKTHTKYTCTHTKSHSQSTYAIFLLIFIKIRKDYMTHLPKRKVMTDKVKLGTMTLSNRGSYRLPSKRRFLGLR